MARVNSTMYLHPDFRVDVETLVEFLNEHNVGGFQWTVFETYRSPEDQARVYYRGTSKVGPMHSAHQYGLAVDILPLKAGKPHWPTGSTVEAFHEALAQLETNSHCPIAWDPYHVESKLWDTLRPRH